MSQAVCHRAEISQRTVQRKVLGGALAKGLLTLPGRLQDSVLVFFCSLRDPSKQFKHWTCLPLSPCFQPIVSSRNGECVCVGGGVVKVQMRTKGGRLKGSRGGGENQPK